MLVLLVGHGDSSNCGSLHFLCFVAIGSALESIRAVVLLFFCSGSVVDVYCCRG